MMRYCRGFIGLTVLVGLIGCGPSKNSVSGTVTYKGAPVGDANVIFTPAGTATTAKIATGLTDAQGKYSLGTDAAGDGVFAGDYMVSIVPNSPPAQEGDYSAAPPPPFPERYTNATSSELKATVQSGDNEFPFELKD